MRKELEIANKTLQIIKDGFYANNNEIINVKELIKASIENTFTIAPNDWTKYNFVEKSFETEIVFKNCSTIQAIIEEANEYKTCALNFASAKNPGGGFLGGASAQEESLARSSSLFPTLCKDMSMYEFNRGNVSFLYSDFMIYSPSTQFWFSDNGDILPKLHSADIITSPAPNKGAMVQHSRDEELMSLNKIFKDRIYKVLHLALSQNIETIILGAWGCGVFRNDANDVASLFEEVIKESFSKSFKRIVFAIYGKSRDRNIKEAFAERFNKQ
jgi:uncharacterized protein (TIGR02452 family)